MSPWATKPHHTILLGPPHEARPPESKASLANALELDYPFLPTLGVKLFCWKDADLRAGAGWDKCLIEDLPR